MGEDKGLSQLLGKALVAHLLETLAQLPHPKVIISSNPLYRQFEIPIVADILPGQGPLGGLLTALDHTDKKKILVLSCDAPFIPLNAIEALMACGNTDQIIAGKIDEKLLPFPGIYPTRLLENVKTLVLKQKLKMHQFVIDNPHHLLDWKSLGINNPLDFLNLNTKSDLGTALSLLS